MPRFLCLGPDPLTFICYSQINASSLDIPREFKIEITSHPEVSIGSEGIYRSAVSMMFDVSALPLDHVWIDREWASRGEAARIYLEFKDFGGKSSSQLRTQHVIWGLNHLMLSMTLSNVYCQTLARLRWQGIEVGTIYVAKRAPFDIVPKRDFNALEHVIAQNNTATSFLTGDDNVECIFSFTGTTPMDRNVIYLTGIKAMGEAAEKGLYQPVRELVTIGIRQVTWKLISGLAGFPGTLKPAHSRVAVLRTVAAMVREERFQKVHIWIKVDGISTAAGGFSQGDLVASS